MFHLNILFIFTMFWLTVAYFEYDDCSSICRQSALCCLIEEFSPTYFPCECLETEIICEMQAKPSAVCLCPGKEAIGGQSIYSDWKKHHSTTTIKPTSTTASSPEPEPPTTSRPPKPTPHPKPSKSELFLILPIFIATLTVIPVGYFLFSYVKRRQYNSIENSVQVLPLNEGPFEEESFRVKRGNSTIHS